MNKTKTRILILILLFLGGYQNVKAQCGGAIDFSTDWFQKGSPSAGDWNVSGGGSTVTQTINGLPTYYVSGENYIDVRINGTFQVNTAGDDDFVGFVFGYNDPISPADGTALDYYLFDWKQAPQPSDPADQEGFHLTKVDSVIDVNQTSGADLFWDHPDGLPGFDVIGDVSGANTGWDDFVEYDFTLTYTSSKIIIEIDGDTIFDVDGCYEPGRFGFYNFSQDDAVYSNFSYELIADFDMSVSETCIDSDVDFEAVNSFCQSGSYVSPITGWSWDLGDGTTVTDTNVTHQYDEPGIYTVELSVSDNFGCVSTVSQDINVKGLIADIDETLICPGESAEVWCNLADDGALYQWFLDGNPISTPTVNDTSITATTDGDYHVEISNQNVDYDPCNTISNTVTLEVENENITLNDPNGTVICSGTTVDLESTTIAGATQYEWFLDGSSQGTGSEIFTANTAGDYYVEVTTANGCEFSSNTMTVTSGTDPVPNISISDDLICPGENSTLSTTTSAGETVQWLENGSPITGETGLNYTTSDAGDYSVEITNTEGCTAISNVETLSISSVPNAAFTSSEPNFCPGVTSITLTASPTGAASYQWYLNGNPITGETNENMDATTDGDYTVEVTNTEGCSDLSGVQTLQTSTVQTFTVTSNVTEFCEGNSADLTTDLESGATYQWFLDGNPLGGAVLEQSEITVSDGGEFYVEVTNSYGCITFSDSITVDEILAPTANISASSTSYCPGDSTLITANNVSGASYQWFLDGNPVGGNSSTLYASNEGDYTVEITDNCTGASNTINISEDEIPGNAGAISGWSDFCPGESLQFNTNNVSNATSYDWEVSPSSAASIGSGQGSTSVTVNTTNQNFSVSVTPINSCGSGDESSIQVNLESTFACQGAVLFSANQTNICEGTQVTFTDHTDNSAFFGTSPEWDFGAGASPATATGNGPHTVTYSTSGLKTVTLQYVDDFSGFVVDEEVKIDYINVNGAVNTSSISGNSALSCNGSQENYSVSNTAGSSYDWTVPNGSTILSGQGSNAIDVNVLSSGTIEVIETTSAGCVGAPVTMSVNLDDGPNTSQISGATEIECTSNSETYTVTNTTGSDYVWEVPTGATITTGQGTNSITVDFDGNFGEVSVTETDSDGCVGSPVSIDVECVNSLTEYDKSVISVYPNPTNHIINIDLQNEGTQTEVFIYDLNGKLLIQKSEINEKILIDVSSLTPGTYIGKTNSTSAVHTFKFVKK